MEQDTEQEPKHIGKNIKAVRKILGVTQVSLAEKLGLHSQTIQHYETMEFLSFEILKQNP